MAASLMFLSCSFLDRALRFSTMTVVMNTVISSMPPPRQEATRIVSLFASLVLEGILDMFMARDGALRGKLMGRSMETFSRVFFVQDKTPLRAKGDKVASF